MRRKKPITRTTKCDALSSAVCRRIVRIIIKHHPGKVYEHRSAG